MPRFTLALNERPIPERRGEPAQHPDRDAQFRYIGAAVAAALAAGQPVISVDTKKKELVGRFAQAGADWRRSGDPVQVSTYDFPHLADGKAIPYGVYDIADDSAWVSVGVDHDTSVFAVATIEKWWEQLGRDKYPNATTLLITADGGGSNGHRPRPRRTSCGSSTSPTSRPRRARRSRRSCRTCSPAGSSAGPWPITT